MIFLFVQFAKIGWNIKIQIKAFSAFLIIFFRRIYRIYKKWKMKKAAKKIMYLKNTKTREWIFIALHLSSKANTWMEIEAKATFIKFPILLQSFSSFLFMNLLSTYWGEIRSEWIYIFLLLQLMSDYVAYYFKITCDILCWCLDELPINVLEILCILYWIEKAKDKFIEKNMKRYFYHASW
jgi:hypothetical protein